MLSGCGDSHPEPPKMLCHVFTSLNLPEGLIAWEGLVYYGQPVLKDKVLVESITEHEEGGGPKWQFTIQFCCLLHHSTCPDVIHVPGGSFVTLEEADD